MNDKVKIQGNKIKVLDAYQDNDQMQVLLVLLIINYSVGGKSLSVPLKKVAFIYDAIMKQLSLDKLAILLASPWEISSSLRKKIILAHEKKYIIIKEKKPVVSFSLSDQGLTLIHQVEQLQLIPELRQEIKNWCKDVKINELKNQHLIW